MGLRIGVIGTGRLGREHVRIFKQLRGVDFVACYDLSAEKCHDVAGTYRAEACNSLEQLIAIVDAVSIVVPTIKHAEISLAALEKGKDVFLEKPLSATVDEALRIVEKAREADRILQVGHVERFNTAFAASLPYIYSPSFIEIERLSSFSLRGTDVSVVMDLMIHDLDLLLLIVGEWPDEIRAKGAGILTNEPDIVNARLEFPGGCVANVTASRVSMEASRKIRIFSRSRYLSIDMKKGLVKHYKKSDSFNEKILKLKHTSPRDLPPDISEFLEIDEFKAEGPEPLSRELESFCHAVISRSKPPVTGEDGLKVLRLAMEVLGKINPEMIP